MAVLRQTQFLGQMRVDSGALRALEAGVAGDFDALCGVVMAGKQGLVVTGFNLVTTGAIGNDATSLVLRTAAGSMINFEAAESGSIFRVPEDRTPEILNGTNPRISGAFTPSTTNFIGLDLKRSADDSTADTVQFLNPDTDTETPVVVPLARTLDYVIVVSTTEFSATPGLCPIAKVVTDSSNKVVSIEDARQLFFRLGAGGSDPSAVSPFSWPGGRNEADPTLATVAGDRSISSLKDWLNAIMTRLWEVGGGEYWYSPTADRNVRLVSNAVFSSSGEPFEVISNNIHWTGLRFAFDNSTATSNEIANQTFDLPGLTDLADGECIYVDLDRTQNHTVSGLNPLQMQKGVLATLGMSTRPGQRFVVAWRIGTEFFTRDQYLPIGSALRVATTSVNGVVRLSATPASSVAPKVATATSGVFMGMSGFSRLGTSTTGDLTIGTGSSNGDHNIVLFTDGSGNNTQVFGAEQYSISQKAAFKVTQTGVANHLFDARITEAEVFDGTGFRIRHYVEADGAHGMALAKRPPLAPAPTLLDEVKNKFFFRPSRFWKAPVVVTTNGDLPAATSGGPAGIGHTLTGGNVVLTIDGVTPVLNDRVLIRENSAGVLTKDFGIYFLSQVGVGGTTPWILTRATDADEAGEMCKTLAVLVSSGTVNAGTMWEQTTADPIVVDTTALGFTQIFSHDYREQVCAMWSDGKYTVVAESDAFLVT
jgi:hypothetical protein